MDNNSLERAQQIEFIFYRPYEPITNSPKGDPDRFCVFVQPGQEVRQTRNGQDIRQIRGGQIVEIPTMSQTLQNEVDQLINQTRLVIKRIELFSLFHPEHQNVAANLIRFYMGLTYDELISAACRMRDYINPELFYYVGNVVLHYNDHNVATLLKHASVFPHKYIHRRTMYKARVEAYSYNIVADRLPVSPEVSGTGTSVTLNYFRDDLGLNLFHVSWYQSYPTRGPRQIINQDRRGEIFYYMYRQLLIRYDVERLCNGLDFTERLQNWTETIPEAYFPLLSDTDMGVNYSPRPPNTRLSDVRMPDLEIYLEDLQMWKTRIVDAIHTGIVIGSGNRNIPITNNDGMNILGNIIQSNELSPNQQYYGNLNNLGHLLLAYINDPQNIHGQPMGVMGQAASCVKDPAFYRWRAYIDDIFAEQRNALPAHTRNDLLFPNLSIVNINVQSIPSLPNQQAPRQNELYTFMRISEFDVSHGLTLSPPGAVNVQIPHLDHDDFEYIILVENRNPDAIRGTVRIFLAPIQNNSGVTFNFNQQKDVMIELDRFVWDFRIGANEIRRRASQSRGLSTSDVFQPVTPGMRECPCAWPYHMLLPRGNAAGYPMQLYVVITDNDFDRVQQNPQGDNQPCNDFLLYCGLKNQKYPDRRPMGFPFDRRLQSNSTTFSNFGTPNMGCQNVRIFFSDQVRPSQSSEDNSTNNTVS